MSLLCSTLYESFENKIVIISCFRASTHWWLSAGLFSADVLATTRKQNTALDSAYGQWMHRRCLFPGSCALRFLKQFKNTRALPCRLVVHWLIGAVIDFGCSECANQLRRCWIIFRESSGNFSDMPYTPPAANLPNKAWSRRKMLHSLVEKLKQLSVATYLPYIAFLSVSFPSRCTESRSRDQKCHKLFLLGAAPDFFRVAGKFRRQKISSLLLLLILILVILLDAQSCEATVGSILMKQELGRGPAA